MAWDAGTITSATPHTALSTKIKALFGGSGVANWSFVENIPAGTGAGQSGSASYSIDVYKCAGSGTDANSSGTDFYVGLRIPVSDGAVASAFVACEDYSPIASASNKGMFRRQTANASMNTVPTGAGFWRNDTYSNEAGLNSASMTTSTLNTSGFSYWIKLTKNMLVWATKVGSTELTHLAMVLDTFVISTTDGCPLVACGSNVGHCGFSRLPSVVSGNADQWRAIANFWTRGPLLATSNAVNDGDIWQSGKMYDSRIMVKSTVATASYFQSGGMRGLMPQDIIAFKPGGTVGLGDTTVIDGNTWTVIAVNLALGSGDSMHMIVRAN